MAAGCIQESCIHERCLTPEDSAAAIGNFIPLRSTPFPISEPYSKFSVFFDYTFLDNSTEIRWDKLSKCNCIDVFDEELYEAFIKCFDEVDNGDKREIARALLKLDWRNNYYSTPDEINESVLNFRKLINYLENKIQSEKDIISKYIYKNLTEELEKMISENTSTA